MKSEAETASSDPTVSQPPVSLEAERRKAMMLIHSVEKDVRYFRENHFRNPRNHFGSETTDFLAFVLIKSETRRAPGTVAEFRELLDKVREHAQLAFPTEVRHMDVAIDRAERFDELVAAASQKLRRALDDHVGRYCHSFAGELGGHDVACVQEYENNIVRWRRAIREALALLADVVRSVHDVASSFESCVQQYDKVLHDMRLALEVLPRISGPLKDWVSADEAFVRKLQDAANELLRRKVAVVEATRRQAFHADDMKSKVFRTNHEAVKLNERLAGAMAERQICRRQEMALADSAGQVEVEMAHKRQALHDVTQQFMTRQFNSEARDRRLMAQSAALQQEVDRLQKRMDAIRMKADRARKERVVVQREVHKLQAMCERGEKAVRVASVDAESKSRDLRELQDEGRVVGEKLAAVRRICALKLRSDIVKRLYTEGYTPGRQLTIIDPLDEACRVAAGDIGKDWAFLYNKLPFTPDRDVITRSHDIRVIVLESQKKEVGQRGAAIRSLAKWKRLSRAASVDTLVHTLRTIKKQAVASKVEKRVSTVSM